MILEKRRILSQPSITLSKTVFQFLIWFILKYYVYIKLEGVFKEWFSRIKHSYAWLSFYSNSLPVWKPAGCKISL